MVWGRKGNEDAQLLLNFATQDAVQGLEIQEDDDSSIKGDEDKGWEKYEDLPIQRDFQSLDFREAAENLDIQESGETSGVEKADFKEQNHIEDLVGLRKIDQDKEYGDFGAVS